MCIRLIYHQCFPTSTIFFAVEIALGMHQHPLPRESIAVFGLGEAVVFRWAEFDHNSLSGRGFTITIATTIISTIIIVSCTAIRRRFALVVVAHSLLEVVGSTVVGRPLQCHDAVYILQHY